MSDLYDERTTVLRDAALDLHRRSKLPGYSKTRVDELRSELAAIAIGGDDSLAPLIMALQFETGYDFVEELDIDDEEMDGCDDW